MSYVSLIKSLCALDQFSDSIIMYVGRIVQLLQ